MTRKPTTISQSQWLVQTAGAAALDGRYWEKFSGISDPADVSKYNDGHSNRQYPHMGPKSLEDVEITKVYDPTTDGEIVRWYKNWCTGDDPITLTIQSVQYCPDPEPIGPSYTLYGCKPINATGYAEIDKGSNEVQRLTLKFAVEDYSID